MMKILKRIDLLLNEAGMITYGWPDTGGLAGDDDAPTGNILMGEKYRKVKVTTPGGSYTVSVPETDWHWGEFEHAKGMEDRDNYHSSLGKQGLFGDRLWRYTRHGDPEEERREMEDIADKEESAPEYVKRVVQHAHTRDDMVKNLPDTVFKIDKIVGQFQTATGEEPEREQRQIEREADKAVSKE